MSRQTLRRDLLSASFSLDSIPALREARQTDLEFKANMKQSGRYTG